MIGAKRWGELFTGRKQAKKLPTGRELCFSRERLRKSLHSHASVAGRLFYGWEKEVGRGGEMQNAKWKMKMEN
jgi:hypothetical protein